MNSIMAIHPYKHHGLWVFDDPAKGLVQEPFIAGADVIIERLAAGIPNADAGFTLVFSTNPFPGYQAEFVWQRADVGDNWYYNQTLGLEGWLCPALQKYFDSPARIYAEFRARSA